jgi:PQQ-dependent dehydrogenase (methanol/ethanol family)
MDRDLAFISVLVVSLCLPCATLAQTGAGPAPSSRSAGAVDDQRLRAASEADGDWITFGHDYRNHRFAPFSAIDRGNVAELAPTWVYELNTVGSAQTHPIVVGGVMYVGMAGNDVAAIDASSGAEIWRYRHKPRTALPQVPSNRGVAVAYDLVFEATDDARVIALEQATGAVKWDHVVPPFDPAALLAPGEKAPEIQFNFRAAPLAYDDKVIVGATGFEANRFDEAFVKASIAAGKDVGTAWIDANLGRRGFVAALDARTGTEVWRWYTTKEDGWEGDYTVSLPDGTTLNRDIVGEKAAAQVYRNAWAAGSNSAWMTPAFDSEMNLIFVGTGNPAPGDVDMVRPGDNLYANGVAALDATTGKLRWFFQQSPHGQYDATAQAVLIEARAGGRTVPAVLECGKIGWCYVVDRVSGKFLFRTDEVTPHQNTFARLEAGASSITVAPGGGGAVGVSPVSYDAGAGVVFVAGRHDPTIRALTRMANVPGGPALFKVESKPAPRSETWGTLTALDIANGGRLLWQVKTPEPLVGGTLATAGGLVFTGEANGRFSAYDAATGKVLWTQQTGTGVGAPPMSYMANGRQFIAVATGAARDGGGQRPGGAIRAFALPTR